MGQSASSSSTSQQTSVSTNTITDSYNQAFTRTENLSDVGNISIKTGDDGGGGMLPIILLGLVGVLVLVFKKKV
jgi:hypothetical protein